ncbi:MAG TPA: hypothetical protein VLG68_04795 [Gammaproteobacteria bacterium]|nr:hypothetical protein [Gammaproteobacteria bacterium]
MSAIPQLNEAESKFFESGGRELTPSLSEGMPPDAPLVVGAAGEPSVPEMDGEGQTQSSAQKENREKRVVPLEALQQERAEKKQLREELKQFRDWQAALTQRLQQLPAYAEAATARQAPAPDPKEKPLDYINHVLGQLQSNTVELQAWRQQQEAAAQQRATVQQYADWAAAQEQEFAKAQPDYRDAYRYAAEVRDKELQALGYSDPTVRANITRMNTAEIVSNALQQGRNPAELVWEYARARGFASKGGKPGAEAKIAAGMQVAGAKLNQGGAVGEGELSAKDLAGITDPEEFEKAWKKVFGRKR